MWTSTAAGVRPLFAHDDRLTDRTQDGPGRFCHRAPLLRALHPFLPHLRRRARAAAHPAHAHAGCVGRREQPGAEREGRRRADALQTRYNLRVVETLVAARVLVRALGFGAGAGAEGGRRKFTLREVLTAFVGSAEAKGQAAPRLAPEEVKAGLEKILGEVERLRPANLRLWEASERGVVEES